MNSLNPAAVHPMLGTVCLVTGGTSGIGRVAAIELARKGARILVTGRDPARGAEVVETIRQAAASPASSSNPPLAEFLPADLSEQAGVRRLATQIRERCDKLHVLINNAGTVFPTYQLTADGIERTLATNHLAPFLLTHLLREPLAAARSARVVTVSSEAHRMGRVNLDDLGGARRYSLWSAYGNSKLENILFTNELARRWQDIGVTTNSLHPGVVRTGIWANSGGFTRFLATLAQPFMISSERGAQTIIHLASSPEVGSVTGAYFIKCREVTPSACARGDTALWAAPISGGEASTPAKLTGR